MFVCVCVCVCACVCVCMRGQPKLTPVFTVMAVVLAWALQITAMDPHQRGFRSWKTIYLNFLHSATPWRLNTLSSSSPCCPQEVWPTLCSGTDLIYCYLLCSVLSWSVLVFSVLFLLFPLCFSSKYHLKPLSQSSSFISLKLRVYPAISCKQLCFWECWCHLHHDQS